jgi:hypothetical protein
LEKPSIKITFQLLEHGDINSNAERDSVSNTTVMASASERYSDRNKGRNTKKPLAKKLKN